MFMGSEVVDTNSFKILSKLGLLLLLKLKLAFIGTRSLVEFAWKYLWD
jgi:hypothetical protein